MIVATLLPMGFGPACAQRSPLFSRAHSILAGSGVLPIAAGTLSPVIRERDQQSSREGQSPLSGRVGQSGVIHSTHAVGSNK